MNLAILPEDFPLLSAAAQSIASQKITIERVSQPPDIFAVGERTFIRFSLAQLSGHPVDQRYWRYFPYSIWLEPERNFSNRPDYLDEYFEIYLPRSLKIAKRAMKWADPLFYVYLCKFKPSDPIFIRLAQAAKSFFSSNAIKSGTPLKTLVDELSFFDSSVGPNLVANSILKTKRGLLGWIAQYELWQGFATTQFAQSAFVELLKFSKEKRRETDYVHLAFDWAINPQNQFRYPEFKSLFVDAVLLTWKGLKPPEVLKTAMTAKLLSVIGDPRVDKEPWQGCNSDAVHVLVDWLNEKN